MANSNGTASNGTASGEESKPKRKNNRQKAQEQPYTPEYEESPRKKSADRPEAFNVLAWLLEGATGLFEELQHNDLGLPEEFWVHAYSSRHEALLALQAVIDDLVKKSQNAQQQAEEKQKRRERRGGIEIG